ncbi:oxidoreductase alpha (molybdopterin) subunit [Opitutus sp. GAS368]|nr:oxidoreductase alpha (molybdopterin) subunit [Opitutus sp. GAS368]
MNPLPSSLPGPRAEPPPETTTPRLKPLPHAAAGLTAIAKSFEHGLGRAGVVRTAKAFAKVNQKDGFDCQSCAWPSPDEKRHVFEFCENGAKAIASEATTRTITAEFFREYSISALAEQSDHWHELQGRLTEPMVLRTGSDHYEPMAWNEAFTLIGERLRALPSPDAAAFYTSGRASNEAAFLYQLFARAYGTNNLPDCSNMCHESSGCALNAAIGIGKGTVTLEDLEASDLIVIAGQNPGTNHPRMMTTLENAKKRGAKIIAINPLREVGLMRVKNPNPEEYSNPLKFAAMLLGKSTALSDLFLPVRLNGDLSLFKALARLILEAEQANPGSVLDRDFIANLTTGFDEFAKDIREGDFAEWVRLSGVAESDIRAAGAMMAGSKRMIICWAMGLTQHKNAVDTIRYAVNLLLLGGHIGRTGAGVCPVRGHSNVQGDRTMGIWEKPPDTLLAALEKEFHFTPPGHHGYGAVEAIKAMHDGRVKAFVALGGNFLQATPDTAFTAEALRRCDLTVHIATKLNRSHLITGRTALILPCLGRTDSDERATGEQFVTVEDSMGIVGSSRGRLKPVSDTLLSEVAIIAGIARATLPSSTINWTGMSHDYAIIRDHISRVIPGFTDFNARISQGPFYLPNGARERVFRTATGRANFHTAATSFVPVAPGRFLLQTMRTHDQFNTTIYGLDDRYRGIHGGRRVVFLHPDDIAALGFQQGLFVDITSHYAGQERIAHRFMVAPYEIPCGCAATYFPEANVLVPIDSIADESETPTSKSIEVSFTASPDQAAAARAHRA